MAEREGFEPSIRFCRILTFQASAFDHSATAPHPGKSGPFRGSMGHRQVAWGNGWAMSATMERSFGAAPSATDIEAMARASLQRLPEPFASHLQEVVLTVEDLADDATLRDMGIEDPFDLTGLYHGLPIGEKSVEQSGALPDRIILYRRAILDEWAADGESLEHLVHHILVHEVGHHFGLSDEDMHRLEDEV
jgi:predicted Zn-dependent protease with MMP-like domain